MQSGFAYDLYAFQNVKDYRLLRRIEIPIVRPEEIVVDSTDLEFKGFDSNPIAIEAMTPIELVQELRLERIDRFIFEVRKF